MLIVCLYTYGYMCIRAKKANSTGEGNLAKAGGGLWSKTTIYVGYSKK